MSHSLLNTDQIFKGAYKDAQQAIQVLPAAGLIPWVYDYGSRTLTNSTTETYVFKTGGSGGTTVGTLTIVYTDSTLSTVSTWTRT